MIDPKVRVVDVDPAGFAWLNGLLAARDVAGDGSVTILHESGEIVRAVHSWRGDLTEAEVGLVDISDADATRTALDADHVVLLDRTSLASLDATVTELGRTCPTQGELLWRSREAWNAHPGVVQSPPPRPSRWPNVAELVAGVPDGSWLVAVCTGAPSWTVGAEVRGGVIVHITSAVPDGADVAIRVELPAVAWEAALAADDPLLALGEAVPALGPAGADAGRRRP